MLVSTTVVSTRIFRPRTAPFSCAIATSRSCSFAITSPPSACAIRASVFASGTLPSPMRVKSRYAKFIFTSRSSVSKLQFRTCFNNNRRNAISAGVCERPRVVLCS